MCLKIWSHFVKNLWFLDPKINDTYTHTHIHAHSYTQGHTMWNRGWGPQNKDQMMSHMSHQWGHSWESDCVWSCECVCSCVIVCKFKGASERERGRKREISSTHLMYSRHAHPVALLPLSTHEWEENFSPLPHTNSGFSIYQGPRLWMGPSHVHLYPVCDLQRGYRGLRVDFATLFSFVLSFSEFFSLSFLNFLALTSEYRLCQASSIAAAFSSFQLMWETSS